MKITSVLSKLAIDSHLGATNHEEVLKELAWLITKSHPSLDAQAIEAVFLEREKLGSTGIGEGIAIPHGKLPTVKTIIACFGRSVQGIDFQSQDGEPTHLFFGLLAPENAAGLHLKFLAKISRLLKEKSFRESLKTAKDSDEIFEILSRADEKL